MAGEITGNLGLRVLNGSFDFDLTVPLNFDQDVAGGGNPGTVNIGNTEEVISFGDITTEGWVIMRNLDSADYVDWGPESGGAMVECGRMEPGEPACFRLFPGLTLRMKASPMTGTATAAAQVYIGVMED